MVLTPLALSATLVASAAGTTSTTSAAPSRVLVMPPQPTAAEGPGTEAWIAEAVADTLPRSLERLGVASLDRDDRQRASAALELPSVPVSLASAIRIAEAGGATRLVVGSFTSQGEAIALALRLIDVERGGIGAPCVASGPRQDLLALVDTLAWDIAEALDATRGRDRAAFFASRPQIPALALEAYGRGLATSDLRARIGHLRSAVRRLPRYAEARLALGRALIERGDHAEASSVLAGVDASSPLTRAARFERGRALLQLGQPREAEALYVTLENEAPTPGVINNRAVALLRQGQAAAAARLLRQAIESGNVPVEVAFNLGFTLFVAQEYEAAAFWLRGLVRQEPGDARLHLVLSWALRRLGQDEEAEQEWKAALAGDAGLNGLRAPDAQQRLERVLTAERPLSLERDARSGAEMAAAHSGRGERLSEAGDLDGALRELTRAAYLDPYAPRLHRSLARVHRKRGENEKALQELRMSLWCHDDVAVRLEAAHLLAELGRKDEACREARLVLRATPDDADARALCSPPAR